MDEAQKVVDDAKADAAKIEASKVEASRLEASAKAQATTNAVAGIADAIETGASAGAQASADKKAAEIGAAGMIADLIGAASE